MREKLARKLCETERAAPDPDATIYIGMRAAKAWEARLPQADALIAAGWCLESEKIKELEDELLTVAALANFTDRH